MPYISVEFHANPWNPMENRGIPGNSHGNPWNCMEVHGFPCKPIKFRGNPLEVHRNPPKYMEFYRNFWNAIDFCGILWIHPKSTGFHKKPWICLEFHGIPWNSMHFHVYPWNSRQTHGFLWIFTEFCGNQGSAYRPRGGG